MQPWTAGNSEQGAEPQPRLCSGLCFLQNLAKLTAFFIPFSIEIWLCINGDEESQLQPGGEEVRALQPFPLQALLLPLQPLGCFRAFILSQGSGKSSGRSHICKYPGMGPAWRPREWRGWRSQKGPKHRVGGACGSLGSTARNSLG